MESQSNPTLDQRVAALESVAILSGSVIQAMSANIIGIIEALLEMRKESIASSELQGEFIKLLLRLAPEMDEAFKSEIASTVALGQTLNERAEAKFEALEKHVTALKQKLSPLPGQNPPSST